MSEIMLSLLIIVIGHFIQNSTLYSQIRNTKPAIFLYGCKCVRQIQLCLVGIVGIYCLNMYLIFLCVIGDFRQTSYYLYNNIKLYEYTIYIHITYYILYVSIYYLGTYKILKYTSIGSIFFHYTYLGIMISLKPQHNNFNVFG